MNWLPRNLFYSISKKRNSILGIETNLVDGVDFGVAIALANRGVEITWE